jgi:hypothetical protein
LLPFLTLVASEQPCDLSEGREAGLDCEVHRDWRPCGTHRLAQGESHEETVCVYVSLSFLLLFVAVFEFSSFLDSFRPCLTCSISID